MNLGVIKIMKIKVKKYNYIYNYLKENGVNLNFDNNCYVFICISAANSLYGINAVIYLTIVH